MLNYWWVTRPKRKLSSVPEVLAILVEKASKQIWSGQRGLHLSFEDALERGGLKRPGFRRDQTGGGGRTYKAWIMSLGLIFVQEATKQIQLTLAGEAIMNGESPVKILTAQVLKYQFPSAYSISRGVEVSPRFKIHPFWFLLKLLTDERVEHLTQDEIAKIIITEAENESDKCYKKIIRRLMEFRNAGDACLSENFCYEYSSSKGTVNSVNPYGHLRDIANTIINWLEYTQLVFREDGALKILPEKFAEVKKIVAAPLPFISHPENHEYFQRRYGLDSVHQKDTRSLNTNQVVTDFMIAELIVKKTFISCSAMEPIGKIDGALVEKISELTGINSSTVQEILQKNYPHGAIGAFMASYFELAFKGHKNFADFEEATVNIFAKIFGFDSTWLGSAQSGREVPDILLVSRTKNFQAIADTKASVRYDLPTTQRDRMIYHYLPDIKNYGVSDLPTKFFTYIAGGFSRTIETPLNQIYRSTGIGGSAVPVAVFIKMAERHMDKPFTHAELKNIFSVNRAVNLDDFT